MFLFQGVMLSQSAGILKCAPAITPLMQNLNELFSKRKSNA